MSELPFNPPVFDQRDRRCFCARSPSGWDRDDVRVECFMPNVAAEDHIVRISDDIGGVAEFEKFHLDHVIEALQYLREVLAERRGKRLKGGTDG